MTPEEFRQRGRQLLDWIADYLENAGQHAVLSQVALGGVRSKLPAQAPERGDSLDAVVADLNEIILPGVTHWQSPNFFAFFPANNSYPSILGDLLSSGLGVQGMMWATSPACTELETLVMDWLVDAMGLPTGFRSDSEEGGGVIQDTASSATLCAIVAARERATKGQSNRLGLGGERLVAYASEQAHSSIEKGLRIAGIGSDNLRLVGVDDAYAIRPDRLRAMIAQDRAAGCMPFFVCATVGTTSSMAFDPVAEIGSICREAGAWLHVDAAMAGTAALCPELRFVTEGLEFADSYVFNPHKWMLVNFDCSAFYVRRRNDLVSALSIEPEYLRNAASESGSVIDYRDWQVPLGRRFRALKLWLTIRSYGLSGLREMIRRHVTLAQEFAGWVRDDPDFEMAAPVRLNLVCFRHRGGDDVNRRLLDSLNSSGRIYLSHAVLGSRYTLRLCVGQRTTERKHVERAWELIREMAARP
jgi:aromatic-L-amino-acid decarboxylase